MNNIDRKSPSLIITDRMRSVLATLDNDQPNVYGPFGFLSRNKLSRTGPAFNGQLVELTSGNYHLGHGYRIYNPVIFRFQSPDSLSPFAGGGLNAYAYCNADPVNYSDPSGHGRISGTKLKFSQIVFNNSKRRPPRSPKPKSIDNVGIYNTRVKASQLKRRQRLEELEASAGPLKNVSDSAWPPHFNGNFDGQSLNLIAKHRSEAKAAFSFTSSASYMPDQTGFAYQIGDDVKLFTGHFDTMRAYHVASSQQQGIHRNVKSKHLENQQMFEWAKAAYVLKHKNTDPKTLPIAQYSPATGWTFKAATIRQS